MKLHELAHARTGDKGDISNIAVILYRAEDWNRVSAALTPESVATHLGLPEKQKIDRYALPQLAALNFVIHGALAGGVTRSLAIDAHGKCIASVLLEMELD
ncbi:MAG: hypothetical protein KJ947_08455 [Alphaproteobacteria bacterium]|jgi:hypothetical protein|nr:hypothetical protein [Alphaproteobacteria bacterium]MBU1549588.1 hypothetical protein [Alphaproteobacteria bacterium]MBU2336443.1 hypothetical protein [Alphaproteobacteria bacterium]MBU2387676.1 hypothetical protein [Alphaproteobacteria bacterium]